MGKSLVHRQPPGEAAFLAPEIELYRRERAAAIARGANISSKHHHDFVSTRHAGGALTFHPAECIGDAGDGCYLVRVW